MTSEQRLEKFYADDVHFTKDLDSVSDWLKQISFATRPIRSTTQIWVVTRRHYGISALVSQTPFRGETSSASRNVGCFLKAKGRVKMVTQLIYVFH